MISSLAGYKDYLGNCSSEWRPACHQHIPKGVSPGLPAVVVYIKSLPYNLETDMMMLQMTQNYLEK